MGLEIEYNLKTLKIKNLKSVQILERKNHNYQLSYFFFFDNISPIFYSSELRHCNLVCNKYEVD